MGARSTQATSVLTNLCFCYCFDGFSLYLTDRLRSRRYEFNQNIVISSQHRAIVLIMNQISFDCPGMLNLFYIVYFRDELFFTAKVAIQQSIQLICKLVS